MENSQDVSVLLLLPSLARFITCNKKGTDAINLSFRQQQPAAAKD